jgi:hypothetical protein
MLLYHTHFLPTYSFGAVGQVSCMRDVWEDLSGQLVHGLSRYNFIFYHVSYLPHRPTGAGFLPPKIVETTSQILGFA